ALGVEGGDDDPIPGHQPNDQQTLLSGAGSYF
ncbi:MAG: hypothetical protein JWM80_1112, partial [Cyanobacteria bacterium RYN_339]|nr:hypothetical protein [Cyanobacteria bacterium RYN_339]